MKSVIVLLLARTMPCVVGKRSSLGPVFTTISPSVRRGLFQVGGIAVAILLLTLITIYLILTT